MQSQFRRAGAQPLLTWTEIELTKVVCHVDSVTSEFEFGETRKRIFGRLCDIPATSGRMKKVYNVCIQLYKLTISNYNLVYHFRG
jgi:hypothetical protein